MKSFVKVIGKNAKGFVITDTKQGDLEAVAALLSKPRWKGGTIKEIYIKKGKEKRQVPIEAFRSLLGTVKEVPMKRHETILSDFVLSEYEKHCKLKGKSARALTAELIEAEISDDGFIYMHNHRNRRLVRVIDRANQISLGITEYLYSISDHEGTLEVVWSIMPSIHDMKIIAKAWKDECEECINQFYVSSDGAKELIGEWEFYKEREIEQSMKSFSHEEKASNG